MNERWQSRERLVRGAVGRISILLLVYPRQPGSYRATTMSPVMSTVRHCPLLPGESIFAESRARSVAITQQCPLKDRAARLFFWAFSFHFFTHSDFVIQFILPKTFEAVDEKSLFCLILFLF